MFKRYLKRMNPFYGYVKTYKKIKRTADFFAVKPSSERLGKQGESKTKRDIWLSLSSKTYERVHDLIIPSKNGTTQIDHLIISPYGLFIVETKNLTGWIFGSERQANWTQALYGDKYSFQNPLRQTYRQKKILAEYLGVPEGRIHTVIYFVGKCTFKTDLPSNVINAGLGRYLKSFEDPILADQELEMITYKVKSLLEETSLTGAAHIQSLNDRHNSSDICPRCGSDLVERAAKKGVKAGSTFLGCSGFPKCRYTKS